MTNPVPPPADQGQGGYPPAPSGQPGQPYQPGQPGQPYPPPGQAYPQGQPGPAYPQQGQPGQAYPQQGQPGQAYPQQGQPVQQGQPYPQGPGQLGPDGQPVYSNQEAPQFGAFPTEKKKGGFGKVALRIGGALLVLIIVFVGRNVLFGDKAKEAKAGDCIASDKDVSKDGTTKTGAKVVDCGSADAKFSVVARVDGETDVQSKSCDKFFKESDEYYVYSSDAGKGYLLCLKPKA